MNKDMDMFTTGFQSQSSKLFFNKFGTTNVIKMRHKQL